MGYDYIMRMIEQFMKALAGIIRARRSGEEEEALELIQKASQQYLNSDISSLIKLSPEQLVEQFRNDTYQIDPEKCIVCADLLYELALLSATKQHHDAALQLKVLSLYLYLNAIPLDAQFQKKHYYDKVVELKKEIPPTALP